jgi:preprotein translocase subunit SecG
MFPILLAVQVLVSISIIALVLLQQGKGADMGAGFGSGASGTVFGARGSGSFLTRTTAILAAVFFINCLLISSPLVRETGKPADSLAERIEQQSKLKQAEQEAAPAITPAANGEQQPVAGTAAVAPEKPDDLPAAPAATASGKPAVKPAKPAKSAKSTAATETGKPAVKPAKAPAAARPGKAPVNDLPQ